MKKIKALSVVIAIVMSLSCSGFSVSAILDPDDYASVCTDFDDALIKDWDERFLTILETRETTGDISVDETKLSFSEPHYCYNFYNMELVERSYYRIVFENEDIIGISYGKVHDDFVNIQFSIGEFEYLAECLENNGKILFGAAIVDGFSSSLIFADDVFYAYNSIVLEDGATDLVFGEIPYSELHSSGMAPPAETETAAETTEPDNTVLSTGDVNMDGAISLLDVVILERINAGSVMPNETQLSLADCVSDEMINGADTIALIQYIVGKVDSLPVIPE